MHLDAEPRRRSCVSATHMVIIGQLMGSIVRFHEIEYSLLSYFGKKYHNSKKYQFAPRAIKTRPEQCSCRGWARWEAESLYFPTSRRSQQSDEYLRSYNMEGQRVKLKFSECG